MSGQGGGSFTADGTMNDIPVINRTHRLLARHDAIERWFRKA
jgi:citrate lyase beta subunit